MAESGKGARKVEGEFLFSTTKKREERTYSYPDEWLAHERAYLPENRLRGGRVIIALAHIGRWEEKRTVRSFCVIS
jgi:hypothetical protein